MDNLDRELGKPREEISACRNYGSKANEVFESEAQYAELILLESLKVVDMFNKVPELSINNNLTCVEISYKHVEVILIWMHSKWVSLEKNEDNSMIVPDNLRTYVLQRIEWLLNQ